MAKAEIVPGNCGFNTTVEAAAGLALPTDVTIKLSK
jgi:hypothetical protein